jgi:two-component system cell cycle sensor histidine kinase/response regulator CckA
MAQRLFSVDRTLKAPRTILVIDDEEGVRMFIDRVLKSAGYNTVVATNGPDALRAAKNLSSLDLIVTDVVMPEMSGCEVARRLRVDHPALKALYITGYSDRLFEDEAVMWDNDAFTDKPCSMQALLQAVALLWSQGASTATITQSVSRGGRETHLAG